MLPNFGNIAVVSLGGKRHIYRPEKNNSNKPQIINDLNATFLGIINIQQQILEIPSEKTKLSRQSRGIDSADHIQYEVYLTQEQVQIKVIPKICIVIDDPAKALEQLTPEGLYQHIETITNSKLRVATQGTSITSLLTSSSSSDKNAKWLEPVESELKQNFAQYGVTLKYIEFGNADPLDSKVVERQTEIAQLSMRTAAELAAKEAENQTKLLEQEADLKISANKQQQENKNTTSEAEAYAKALRIKADAEAEAARKKAATLTPELLNLRKTELTAEALGKATNTYSQSQLHNLLVNGDEQLSSSKLKRSLCRMQ